MAVGSGLTASADGLFMVWLVVLGLCNVLEWVKAQASFKTVVSKRPNYDAGFLNQEGQSVCVCVCLWDECEPAEKQN